MRLHGAKAFSAVYGGKRRAVAGILAVFALPNGHPYNRLGLSVPRGGGTAVTRNKIKRRLREAFRRSQHDLPTGYDLTIRVRTHAPRSVAEYQVSLMQAVRSLHESWSRQRP